MRVYLVDDSEVMRSHLRELVAAVPGATLAGEAADASTAIAGILATTPNAVVLDVEFPGGGGLRVLSEIRAQPQAVRPLVIVLTNFPDPEYRQRFLDDGADFFLDKAREFERLGELLAGTAP